MTAILKEEPAGPAARGPREPGADRGPLPGEGPGRAYEFGARPGVRPPARGRAVERACRARRCEAGRRFGPPWAWLGGAAVGGLATALVFLGLGRPRVAETRDSLSLSVTCLRTWQSAWVTALALSPDGRSLVYRAFAATCPKGACTCAGWVKRDAKAPRRAQRMLSALSSPPTARVGFLDRCRDRLKAVPLSGGAVRTLCGRRISTARAGERMAGSCSRGGSQRQPRPRLCGGWRAGGAHHARQEDGRRTRLAAGPAGRHGSPLHVEMPGRPMDDARIVVQDLTTGATLIVSGRRHRWALCPVRAHRLCARLKPHGGAFRPRPSRPPLDPAVVVVEERE